MREAGLTHGGFYKHFGSRDELIAEAAQRSYDDTEQAAEAVLEGAEDPLRRSWTGICPKPTATTPERMPRGRARGRRCARRRGVARRVHRPGAALPRPPSEELLGTDGDTAALSTLVGALVLSRAVSDPELSARILRDSREAVVSGRSDI